MARRRRFRPSRSQVAQTRTALEEAREGREGSGAIDRVIRTIMAVGIDGAGPVRGARATAERALRAEGGDVERAVRRVVRTHTRGGAVGGVVTGVGGFTTMAVALPVNLLEFYVQATRMVAAIASLRGHDVDDPHVRTAVMLTLVGSDANDVLEKAGMATGTGRVASFALKRLPASSLMVVNKAIGFRLLRGVGERFLTRLGRGVPLIGGLLGGALDAVMMRRIAAHARKQLPA
ncbi:EcsC family protein [Litorihabitans aurantiacus]|uniref:EcsC family protein n=1 Tax=Litorihabitans aurantiacus TaxID=1930061 RepID=A0AA37XDL2_9MICO|nr:EcsC family protein [Litorihabitans aurantiacus]GMA31348.1 hypothetical protein GCM10025875_13400 [Litorihabitans aurantiacus]